MRFWSNWVVAVMAAPLLCGACGGKGGTGTADEAGNAGAAGTAASLGGADGDPTAGRAGSGSGEAGGVGGKSAGGSSSGGQEDSGGGGVGGGGVSGGSAGDDSGAATVAALAPTINAFCAAARSCCTKQNLPATLTDCESQFPMNNDMVASLASGAAKLDMNALAKCLAAYEEAATSCDENPVLSACRGVVIGTRAENAACTSGSECARDPGPNTCLITEQNGTVGVCKKIPHAAAGEACTFTCRAGEDCTFTTYGAADSPLALCFEDDGVYCDYTGPAAVCKPLVALNSACSSDDECGYTNYCQSTCKKRGVEGEACAPCISSLTCVDDECVTPPFASVSTCEGRSLGPY
jgi:hypothetical protein